MVITFCAAASLDQFGFGFYCTRVRNPFSEHEGMKFSFYILWAELYVIFDLGEAN